MALKIKTGLKTTQKYNKMCETPENAGFQFNKDSGFVGYEMTDGVVNYAQWSDDKEKARLNNV